MSIKSKALLDQKMSEDVWSREKCPICFPKLLNVVHDAHWNVVCTTRKLLAGETRRARYLQDLFIQDQASVGLHLDFITSSPSPISLYLKKHCQENKVPQDCLLIKG